MEEEKKKKKNKKKKNKQNKTTEGVGETDPLDQNHVDGQNLSETSNVQNAAAETPILEQDRQRANGTEGVSSEETVKQLEGEKDSYIQKLAGLEVRIVQLQSKKDLWLQKEASFEEKISQLLNEKASLSLKGENLVDRIKHLTEERDSLVLKKANLEDAIKNLTEERDSLIQNENSTKETIASLNDENTRLHIQVAELERSKRKILQENERLVGNLFGLQSQIQNLENTSSNENTKIAAENEEMEATRELAQKLITENTELMEKVNDLYIELGRRNVQSEHDTDLGTPIEIAEKSLEAVPIKEERIDGENVVKIESLEVVSIKDENTDYSKVAIPNSSETSESGEIVQIPLDENEVQAVESEAGEKDEEIGDVGLTDAPLIGAPFRFISFVAKYVSGADLVSKSSSESG